MGLRDKTVPVFGTINLPLVLGDKKYKREQYAKFAVTDIPFTYNVIYGRSILNCPGRIINMGASCLKLPTLERLAIVRGSQKSAQECYRHSTKSLGKATMLIDLLEKPDSHIKPELADPYRRGPLGSR